MYLPLVPQVDMAEAVTLWLNAVALFIGVMVRYLVMDLPLSWSQKHTMILVSYSSHFFDINILLSAKDTQNQHRQIEITFVTFYQSHKVTNNFSPTKVHTGTRFCRCKPPAIIDI